MAFADTLHTLPFTPRTTHASGFLPPLLRAIGHILYALGCLADETVPKTDEEILNELRHARTHWDARTDTEAISTTTRDRATAISQAISEAIEEYPEWDTETRTANIRDFAHRLIQYSADLDRELVGLRDSDPGTSL